MDSRERVIRTLKFQGPDRLPLDLWILPAARIQHGEAFEKLLEKHERDIATLDGPIDLSFDPVIYKVGSFFDPWGNGWNVLQEGIIGEVKKPALYDAEKIGSYVPPISKFKSLWKDYRPVLDEKIKGARGKGKFVIGGWVNLFERMQFLRGPEELYCDLALQNDEAFKIRDIVVSFYREYLNHWLETDIDAVVFGDDWGSQRALLVSPKLWRSFFKPVIKELIDMVISKGKYVFVHSDGYIMDLYPEFIELGVSAINSQLWCMGVEDVAEKYAGKITFWGEISRQSILPKGTPDEVRTAAYKMKKYLYINGGGLIGQSEVNRDVPFENIETLLTCWY